MSDEEHYKNKADYLDKRELELLAEIKELKKKLQESALDYISVCSQADEHYARVQELEKDLHMVQRHYDQLNLPDGYVVVCVHCAKELKIEFNESTDPFIWMDDCGTWFTNEAYQALDADLKDGLFPLYTSPNNSDLEAKVKKYEEALHAIANDYHELSDHKIEVQVRNHKKWAREALE